MVKKKRFSFFSDLREMKEEFKEMNYSLDFIKKITVILTVIIITSSMIILAKGD